MNEGSPNKMNEGRPNKIGLLGPVSYIILINPVLGLKLVCLVLWDLFHKISKVL